MTPCVFRPPLIVAFTLLLLGSVTVVWAQVITEMTPAHVAQAIAEGQKTKAKPYKAGDCQFTTPYLRVVLASAAAKANYKPFTAADVTAEMIAPVLEVYIPTDHGSPRRGYGLFSPTNVVIMPKDSQDAATAIQPVITTPVAERFQNLYGASVDTQAVLARFPLSALADRRELRVRYNDGGERRHGLKTKGVR